MNELIIDLFAGGGGASQGIRMALGRDPDVAVNHDAVAVAMHAANHLGAWHLQQDVWEVHPRWATRRRPVALLWASPDCTHFSKAKGGPPVRDIKRRSLAWVVERWAREVRPRVILLENVEEFQNWGPLSGAGEIVQSQKGDTFRAFTRRLRRLGYSVEWRERRACDYGAPTIRKRLFLIARCDGNPIVWPEPTHGPGRLPYRTAAEIIDWSIPCPSIFERKRPLAENTLRRIAEGIRRYVIEAAEPFIVRFRGSPTSGTCSINAPLPTITAGAYIKRPAGAGHALGLCVPYVQTYYGPKRPGDFRGIHINDCLRTQSTENRFALVAAFLAKHYGGVVGQDLRGPVGTVTSIDHHSLVSVNLIRHFGHSVGQEANAPAPTTTAGGSGKTGLVTSRLVKLRGTCKAGQPVSEPMPTITSGGLHIGEVRAFLLKYYGTDQDPQLRDPLHTLTTKHRFGVVTINIQGEPYIITDIGMRMLSPRELFRAQGFPDSYKIDIEVNGKRITKTDQVRMVGNSVCPPIAAELVRANLESEEQIEHTKEQIMNGVELIAQERKRHEEEGWTAEHDDQHTEGELAQAAACYCLPDLSVEMSEPVQLNSSRGVADCYLYDYGPPPELAPGQIRWPWDTKWYKRTPEDRVRELVKAGSLIAAEIDRLQRRQEVQE